MRTQGRAFGRTVVAMIAVGLLGSSALTPGQTIEFIPTGSTGPFEIAGHEITVPLAGVQVEFEVVMTGWGNAPGAPRLGAYNATLVGTSLLGVNADPSQPGVDLTVPGQVGCASAADCGVPSPPPVTTIGTCGVFESGKCDDFQPAFTVQKRCFVDSSIICAVGGDCGGQVPALCIEDPAFVMGAQGLSPVVAVSIPANNNIEWIAAASGGGSLDDAGHTSAGFLRLIVPGGGKGTWTISWNPDGEKSFFNDAAGLKIFGLTLIDGQVTIETGACCSPLGANTICFDGDTAAECDARPGPRLYRPGRTCKDATCSPCFSDASCTDPVVGQAGADNLCTRNICSLFSGLCENQALFDATADCCNADRGPSAGLTPIDDADDCTVDTCDPATGVVDHRVSAADGLSCDDLRGCTVDDTCDGVNSAADGGCIGTDSNTLECVTNDDCPVGECDRDTGMCICSGDTPLCVENVGNVCEGTSLRCVTDEDCDAGQACVGLHLPDGNCVAEGDTVEFAIAMGAGSEFVTGGQFLIQYDPSCLDLDPSSVAPCPGSIFTSVIDLQIDEVAGEVFYAATVNGDSGNQGGTIGPEDIACLSFTKLAGCDECDICLVDQNPRNTILTDRDGNRVAIASCGCGRAIRLAGEIDLSVPAGVETNPDCDRATAFVSWSMPSATDSCDGDLAVTCRGESAFAAAPQHVVDELIPTGGTIPQGRTFFLCSASNSCGATQRGVWTVDVSDSDVLDVIVQLSPAVNPSGFDRAIEFGLFSNCTVVPTTICEVLTFGGPMNLVGQAVATIETPNGNPFCMTAHDPLHTLRSAADVECVNRTRIALYRGDPLLGGNWLVGGNLDAAADGVLFQDRNTINILDFGTFIGVIASGNLSAPPNTTCDMSPPHADINGDGAVDSLDFSFLLDNFLAVAQHTCCPGPLSAAGELVATEEITVKELRRRGLARLSVADLNGDGVLNTDDMTAYLQGVRPASLVKQRDHVRRKTSDHDSR